MSEKTQENESKDKLSFGKKFSYGMAAFADNGFQNTFGFMANPVFNVTLGLDPRLVGIAMAVPRIWDAFTDPVAAYFSDRCRSRWGRRKPFILVGAFCSALLFVLFWNMLGHFSPRMLFWYLLIGLCFFYTAFTVFSVPYIALGNELTGNIPERTRLMGFRSFFQLLSAFVVPWIFWFTQRPVFEDTLVGMRYLSRWYAIVLFLCAVAPVLGVRERFKQLGVGQKQFGFIASFSSCLKMKPFLFLLGGITSFMISMLMIGPLSLYINVYYIYEGDQAAASVMVGTVNTVQQICSIISIPFVSMIGARIGKRKAMLLLLVLSMLGFLLMFFCYRPAYPWLQLLPVILIAPGAAGLWQLLFAMLADICDVDEFKTRQRREASYSAVLGWVLKMSASLSMVIAGVLISFSGFNINLGAHQTADTLLRLRLAYSVVASAGLFIAIWFFSLYPLRESKLEKLKVYLERRRLVQECK